MKTYALILAGGSGRRMGAAVNKVLLPVAGVPCLRRSVDAFAGLVDEAILVCRLEDRPAVEAAMEGCALPLHYALGGSTRQASVRSGLLSVPFGPEDLVLVHDGARCLVTAEIISRVLASCLAHGSGVAAVPVSDTIRRPDPAGAETLDRSRLLAIQTPQGFFARRLLEASVLAERDGFEGTDDASLLERLGQPVSYVEGGRYNLKLTSPEDLIMAEALLSGSSLSGGQPLLRIGQGYDVHRFAENRKLILCGVEVPCDQGLLGHSDADVALHALMDAMLGAAALGDIGQHFPDTDPAYSGISSLLLLEHVRALLSSRGFTPVNLDITIVAQRPKLAPWIPAMRQKIADALRLSPDLVSVKATTTEKLGFEGRCEGISAQAVCLLLKAAPPSKPLPAAPASACTSP